MSWTLIRAPVRRGSVLAGVVMTAAVLVVGLAGRAWAATCQDPTGQPGQPAFGVLHGVALRGCKAWAVGFWGPGLTELTLVEFWNGKSWNVQPSANPGGTRNYDANELYGVAATSSTHAWAVGDYFKGVNRTLVERWNGTKWKVQKSPSLGVSELFGVAATSSTNAWAVGSYSRDGGAAPDQALIERWNGTAWKVQQTPKPGGATHSHDLNAVAATSRRNAWAVGSYRGNREDLVLHWNGAAWKVQKSPNPTGAAHSVLTGVAATSRTNAWAVGSYHGSGTDLTQKPFILHWDGTAWRVQKTPNPADSNDTELTGVAATSPTNAWAVGYYYNGVAGVTLVLHWNGTAWKMQPSPNPGGNTDAVNFLYGVAATSSTNAWMIGHYFNDADTIDGPLALHWDGTAWKG